MATELHNRLIAPMKEPAGRHWRMATACAAIVLVVFLTRAVHYALVPG